MDSKFNEVEFVSYFLSWIILSVSSLRTLHLAWVPKNLSDVISLSSVVSCLTFKSVAHFEFIVFRRGEA